MKRQISVQTDGIFQPFGVDEGMRLISRAGIDCVDLDLIYISYSSIRKGIIHVTVGTVEPETGDVDITPSTDNPV